MDTTKYITLNQAARLAPSRPALSTLWRWARRGVLTRTNKRVHLKHVRCGRHVYTTAADLEAFFREVAEADAPYFERQTGKLAQQASTKNHKSAVRELRKKGVL